MSVKAGTRNYNHFVMKLKISLAIYCFPYIFDEARAKQSEPETRDLFGEVKAKMSNIRETI